MKRMGFRLLALVLAGALLTGCWGMDDASSSGGMSSSMTPSPSPVPSPGSQEDEMDSSHPAQAAAAQPAADWRTLLVNAEHPLPADFAVETAPVENYEDRLFDARAVEELNAMLKGAADAGLPLYLVSTYRSVERQTALYKRKVNYYLEQGLAQAEAEQQAARWVAAPGTSEHNLGLAADIVSANWYSENDDLKRPRSSRGSRRIVWSMALCCGIQKTKPSSPGWNMSPGITGMSGSRRRGI